MDTIFQLRAGTAGPEPAYSADRLTLEETRAVIYLPPVYCDGCHLRYSSETAFPIPEAAQLGDDHPLLVRLRRLYSSCARENSKVNSELSDFMISPDSPKDHPNWQRLEEAGTITPDEFWALAEELRRALSLPTDRRMRPGNRVGRLEVRCTRVRIPDINLGPVNGFPIVVNEPVLDALNDARCTGYRVFPVTVARRKGSRPASTLFELQVTGRAGLPGPGSGT